MCACTRSMDMSVMMSHTIGIITSYTNMMGCNDQPAMLDNIDADHAGMRP